MSDPVGRVFVIAFPQGVQPLSAEVLEAAIEDHHMVGGRGGKVVEVKEGVRLMRVSDFASILAMLPPPPIQIGDKVMTFQQPNAADRLHQVREAFLRMLAGD